MLFEPLACRLGKTYVRCTMLILPLLYWHIPVSRTITCDRVLSLWSVLQCNITDFVVMKSHGRIHQSHAFESMPLTRDDYPASCHHAGSSYGLCDTDPMCTIMTWLCMLYGDSVHRRFKASSRTPLCCTSCEDGSSCRHGSMVRPCFRVAIAPQMHFWTSLLVIYQ